MRGRPVYIVDGGRTPFLSLQEGPGPLSAADLGLAAARPLLERQSFEPDAIDELIVGNLLAFPSQPDIARSLALRLGCGERVAGFTVQRGEGSGLQAIDTAAQRIAGGGAELILAGGCEAASQAPLLFPPAMAEFRAAWRETPSLPDRLRLLADFHPGLLRPRDSLDAWRSDPATPLDSVQGAEELAALFDIERTQLDDYARQSLRRAAAAQYPEPIEPLFSPDGRVFSVDDGPDPALDADSLAQLPPLLDPRLGRLTAGNSAAPADGAAWLLLAGERAVKQHRLPVLGRLLAVRWVGLEPRLGGLGAAHATAALLRQQRCALSDIDCWEWAEKDAAQLLACLQALTDAAYCKARLGWNRPPGRIDPARLNVHGGAIAIGDPLSASGVHIVLRLMHVLNRRKGRRGIAAVSIGGGQGGAVLLEGLAAL